MKTPEAVLLFSYGTLQRPDIQIATFGRELTGREDALVGYVRHPVPIHDPRVIEELGESNYWTVRRSSKAADVVNGMVFEITKEELAAADRYEQDADYRRIRVKLRSGIEVWVYLRG